MNYEHNKKYFSATLFSKLAIVCWALTGMGALVLFLRVFELWYIFGIGGVIACVLGFVFSSYSMKDNEYDEICQSVSDGFKPEFIEYIKSYINRGNAHSRNVDDIDNSCLSFSSSYLYGDGVLVKCGSDKKIRTSKYSVTGCYLGKKALIVGYVDQSLISDDGQKDISAIEYANATKAEAYRPETLSELADYCLVRICRDDGTVFEFIKANDAELDKLVELINTRIAQAKATE